MSDKSPPLGPDAPELVHLKGFEGKVKGALVKSVLNDYEHRYPGCTLAMKAHLGREYLAVLDEGLLASSWYPEVFFVGLLRAIKRVTPRIDEQSEAEEARKVFRELASGYHKMFYRVVGAERLIKLMRSQGWGLYHQSGEWVVDRVEPGAADVRLVGNPALLESPYTEGTTGAITASLEFAGAKNVTCAFEREPPDTVHLRLRWTA